MLYDRRIPTKGKGKFYKTNIRSAMLVYGTEFWDAKVHRIHKMSVAGIWMLRWMCSHTRLDRIRNDHIHQELLVAVSTH